MEWPIFQKIYSLYSTSRLYNYYFTGTIRSCYTDMDGQKFFLQIEISLEASFFPRHLSAIYQTNWSNSFHEISPPSLPVSVYPSF